MAGNAKQARRIAEKGKELNSEPANEQRRGMFVFLLPIIICGVAAAVLQTVGHPRDDLYHLGGVLLIIGAIMAVYTAYWWMKFAPPSTMFFGLMVVCFAVLAIMSF